MATAWLARVRRLNAHNLTTFRDAPLAEISGSLGDLGTLLPLMIALAAKGYIDLGSTLVFSGFFNVLTGVVFGIPLPVQPMKPLGWIHPALDNRVWALAAFLVLILTQNMPRFPYALSFFLLALVLALIQVSLSHQSLPWFHVWQPHFVLPSWIGHGDAPALWMAIGQLPLTTLNSIIAVSALAADLLPDLPAPSVTSIGLSVALMNLTGTWFGAMPVCHGAGGLAAQFRFGARSGASVIFLGLLKIALGLLFGETLVNLLKQYPKGLLGVMVVAAGLELAKVGHTLNQGAPDLWHVSVGQSHAEGLREHRHLSDEERLERWTVMLVTTAGLLAFRNDAVGFLAGMLCHSSYRLSERFLGWKSRRSILSSERAPLLR
ncbi:hypothetical protein BBK36DRAFT_1189167 [Trichoderma citrinoviride]|uniref:Sulfate transporter n=1 Tax=Trichoderma citrinoviride TaxID=58853 RepID=A0A2T4BKZ5_9HYPO|nr:hypothetical protein BBK36DRAFT_1189167 [Trichoderma citrinoviride]PTB69992.1 hypothetical protein BBK36DRAFT_1189167 [Trichoderma citrinoviride]